MPNELSRLVFDEPGQEFHQTKQWLISLSLGLTLFWGGFIRFYQLGIHQNTNDLNEISWALINAAAGVLALPLTYTLAKRFFREKAGLIASLLMAVYPMILFGNPSIVIDGILPLSMCLAIGIILRATETGKLCWLVLGGIIVGFLFFP